ncbi:hypothetical protein [Fusobacterium varium]|uniref:hypothetical protein n=1 Tax=Fusobacterium varium TaxID=856 RepID=UPI00266CB596|nr:hypothetical protein [Fusobacterium varium]
MFIILNFITVVYAIIIGVVLLKNKKYSKLKRFHTILILILLALVGGSVAGKGAVNSIKETGAIGTLNYFMMILSFLVCVVASIEIPKLKKDKE